MQTQNKTNENEFHAGEYMRQIRTELTEQFLQDKQKYLQHLRQVMADFKLKQSKVHS